VRVELFSLKDLLLVLYCTSAGNLLVGVWLDLIGRGCVCKGGGCLLQRNEMVGGRL